MPDINTDTRLSDLLANYRDRDWYFVSPGGNWGDSLIYAGAHSLANSLGLRRTDLDYRSIVASPPPTGSCIYLHGGGGLNPWCSGRAFTVLRAAMAVPDALVVQGPQTCDIEDEDTRRLFAAALEKPVARQLHFFAREPASAAILAHVLPGDTFLHVDHDTAFHLPLAELLALAELPALPDGRYRLVVSREDDESASGPLAAGRDAVRLDPAGHARSFRHWLRLHAYAIEINSNRLHSAIVGSLLGKPVTLLPGSYHKNRSVWEYSLRGRGVTWREQLAEPAATGEAWPWLPARVRASWKVRRLLLRLRGVPLG